MTRLQGIEFSNGPTCRGVSYAMPGAKLDLAEISIDGRYPEAGWAKNRQSDELVRVSEGEGLLTIRGGETVQIQSGDVVHVPTGEQFYWQGNMTIWMACSPSFNPEQYEVEEDYHE